MAETKRCGKCGGRGRIHIKEWTEMSWDIWNTVKCDQCGGTGRVVVGKELEYFTNQQREGEGRD